MEDLNIDYVNSREDSVEELENKVITNSRTTIQPFFSHYDYKIDANSENLFKKHQKNGKISPFVLRRILVNLNADIKQFDDIYQYLKKKPNTYLTREEFKTAIRIISYISYKSKFDLYQFEEHFEGKKLKFKKNGILADEHFELTDFNTFHFVLLYREYKKNGKVQDKEYIITSMYGENKAVFRSRESVKRIAELVEYDGNLITFIAFSKIISVYRNNRIEFNLTELPLPIKYFLKQNGKNISTFEHEFFEEGKDSNDGLNVSFEEGEEEIIEIQKKIEDITAKKLIGSLQKGFLDTLLEDSFYEIFKRIENINKIEFEVEKQNKRIRESKVMLTDADVQGLKECISLKNSLIKHNFELARQIRDVMHDTDVYGYYLKNEKEKVNINPELIDSTISYYFLDGMNACEIIIYRLVLFDFDQFIFLIGQSSRELKIRIFTNQKENFHETVLTALQVLKEHISIPLYIYVCFGFGNHILKTYSKKKFTPFISCCKCLDGMGKLIKTINFVFSTVIEHVEPHFSNERRLPYTYHKLKENGDFAKIYDEFRERLMIFEKEKALNPEMNPKKNNVLGRSFFLCSHDENRDEGLRHLFCFKFCEKTFNY